MFKRTKIVATLGPATDRPGVIDALIRAGVNVARLNFSHGSAADHRRRVDAVRAACRRTGESGCNGCSLADNLITADGSRVEVDYAHQNSVGDVDAGDAKVAGITGGDNSPEPCVLRKRCRRVEGRGAAAAGGDIRPDS